MTSPLRVKGHTLRGEGAAFRNTSGGVVVQERWYSIAGSGFGLCSCGARSDILDSANQRKAWHRNHKSAVVAR